MELSAGFRREPAVDLEAVGEDEGLAARIRAEIDRGGPMTFARFMELALYDPDGGYYRAEASRPGRAGDFLTAPETHPIFGAVLAGQLAEAWDVLGRPDPFAIREHGAGAGALAESVLRTLAAEAPPVLAAVRYEPVEVDPRRIAQLTDRLTAAGLERHLAQPQEEPVTGVVLGNEVLDALPVHRVGVREGRLLERYVGVEGTAFVDVWGEPSSPALATRLAAEGVSLAEGQSAEIGLALDPWVAEAAGGLGRGLMLLVDYGAPAGELYDPARRPHGTLRAYLRHRVHDDVYRHVGRQDLTAHVDLTALDEAARAAGLEPVGATTQAEFLVGGGLERRLQAVRDDPATSLRDYVELRSAVMRLIDPAATGGFRVLAYGRGWPAGVALSGFAFRGPRRR